MFTFIVMTTRMSSSTLRGGVRRQIQVLNQPTLLNPTDSCDQSSHISPSCAKVTHSNLDMLANIVVTSPNRQSNLHAACRLRFFRTLQSINRQVASADIQICSWRTSVAHPSSLNEAVRGLKFLSLIRLLSLKPPP